MPKNIVIFSDGTGQDGGARPREPSEQRPERVAERHVQARERLAPDLRQVRKARRADHRVLGHVGVVVPSEERAAVRAPRCNAERAAPTCGSDSDTPCQVSRCTSGAPS